MGTDMMEWYAEHTLPAIQSGGPEEKNGTYRAYRTYGTYRTGRQAQPGRVRRGHGGQADGATARETAASVNGI
jgi:hypothetical protein